MSENVLYEKYHLIRFPVGKQNKTIKHRGQGSKDFRDVEFTGAKGLWMGGRVSDK